MINTPPSAPGGLQAQVNRREVVLSWSPSSDEQTVSSGLTYNLSVGTEPGGMQILSPLANPTSGRRALAAPGNAWQSRRWVLRDLPPGDYFWKVQALDPSYAGSAFSEEGVFSMGAYNPEGSPTSTQENDLRPDGPSLEPAYPSPFNTETTISYSLSRTTTIRVAIVDLLGSVICILDEGTRAAGNHRVAWDGTTRNGTPSASGVYFLRLETAEGFTQNRSVVLLR